MTIATAAFWHLGRSTPEPQGGRVALNVVASGEPGRVALSREDREVVLSVELALPATVETPAPVAPVEAVRVVRDPDGLTLRVWQSLPHERVGELAELRLRSRLGDDYLRLGYLKAFMDGTLGSQTAWMLDGSGVVITSGDELAEIVEEWVLVRVARGLRVPPLGGTKVEVKKAG